MGQNAAEGRLSAQVGRAIARSGVSSGVMSRIAPPVLWVLSLLTACLLPTGGPPVETGGTSGSTGAGSSGSTGSGEMTEGTGGSAGATTGAASGTGAAGSTGEPAAAPEVTLIEVKPDPIVSAGPVTITARATGADAVTMRVDGGAPIEMTPGEPERFVAQVPVISYLFNGTHFIELTPARGGLVGAPLEQPFAVKLPPGGTMEHWREMLEIGGKEFATAAAAGADGRYYIGGTLDPAGTHRCFLRRFDAEYDSEPEDLLKPLVPDAGCEVVDLAVTGGGRVYVLMQRELAGTTRWWLAEKSTWDGALADVRWGPPGARARALALAGDGSLAVCGEWPTGFGDVDAFVEWYAPLHAWSSRTFDHAVVPGEAHGFDDVARDCAFVGDRVVAVGDVVGEHADELPGAHRRDLVIEIEPATGAAAVDVAGPSPGTLAHSSTRAVAADDAGGYVTAGYVCEDICEPWPRVRRYALGVAPLDEYYPEGDLLAPTAIAWSPAGYAVVAGGLIVEPLWSKAWAEAWVPGDTGALWTFSFSYSETPNMAYAAAIGPFGFVHLAGVATYVNKKLTYTMAFGSLLHP